MSDLIWLSEAQMRRIEPYFPLSHGERANSARLPIRATSLHSRSGPVASHGNQSIAE